MSSYTQTSSERKVSVNEYDKSWFCKLLAY